MRTIHSVIGSLFLLCCLAAGTGRAGDAPSVDATRELRDVKGLVKLGTVRGKATRPLASPDGLRTKAIAQAKAEAAKLGATIILITVDDFAALPVNNVSVEAIAYGQPKDEVAAGAPNEGTKVEEKKDVAPGPATATIAGDVEVTRSRSDIDGKTRLGTVHGKSTRAFGSPDSLRTKAIAQAKAEAAKLGATIILITIEDFAALPLNNVTVEAVAYK